LDAIEDDAMPMTARLVRVHKPGVYTAVSLPQYYIFNLPAATTAANINSPIIHPNSSKLDDIGIGLQDCYAGHARLCLS
jgi:hypothetical protein